MCASVVASMSWTVTLTRLPARCTAPSSTFVTPSCHADLFGREFCVPKPFNGGAGDHLHRLDLAELGQDVVVDAVDEEGIVF
jgi:hypothetical protein